MPIVSEILPNGTLVEVKGRVAKQSPPQKSNRQRARRPRRGGRNKRRRGRKNGRGGGQMMPFQGMTYPLSEAPSAVTSLTPQTYHRQIGNPRHKDYGVGVRFAGSSIWGVLHSYIASAAGFVAARFNSDDWTELLSSSWSRKVYSVHPFNITRLNNECANWSRYCFREITIQYIPLCPSSTTGGFAYALTRDPMYNIDNLGADFSSIVSCNPSTGHATWLPSRISTSANTTDRTWPCEYPLFDPAGFDTAEYPWVAPYIENAMQFNFQCQWSTANASAGDYGIFLISYVCDLYEPRYVLDPSFLVPFPALAPPPLSSGSGSSSSTSSASSTSLSSGSNHAKSVWADFKFSRPVLRPPLPVNKDSGMLQIGRQRRDGDSKLQGPSGPTSLVSRAERADAEIEVDEEIPPPPRLKRQTGVSVTRSSSTER